MIWLILIGAAVLIFAAPALALGWIVGHLVSRLTGRR